MCRNCDDTEVGHRFSLLICEVKKFASGAVHYAVKGAGHSSFNAGITSLAKRRRLFAAVAIGMDPYLKTNIISSVPKALASSVARAMVCSGVPQGWLR